MLPALSSVCQMPWGIEGFIISSQDWGKHIIVVKLCMAFESRPEWLEELFSAEYYWALIQCLPQSAPLLASVGTPPCQGTYMFTHDPGICQPPFTSYPPPLPEGEGDMSKDSPHAHSTWAGVVKGQPPPTVSPGFSPPPSASFSCTRIVWRGGHEPD